MRQNENLNGVVKVSLVNKLLYYTILQMVLKGLFNCYPRLFITIEWQNVEDKTMQYLQKKLFLIFFLIFSLACISFNANAAMKVIMDTDFSIDGDDGQTLIMAAQLHKQKKIELLGVTVVTGNNWLQQEVVDALKAVERLGIEDEVGVYAGALYPLVHDPKSFDSERKLFGFGESYLTAFHRPEPKKDDLIAPLGSFATKAKLRDENAVDYIIDTIKKNPHEVSILVIGPATNLALAVRKNPEIVPLIKQIIYMGGAFDVHGNTTPAAEMNIWVDPEAARIVMREAMPQVIIPLDATNLTQLDKATFEKITTDGAPNAALFKDSWIAKAFAKNPHANVNVFDTLALAYMLDPTLAIKTDEVFVDVDVTFGPGYGRTYGYWQKQPTDLLQKIKVVKQMDSERFLKLYGDLMTLPVPVQ